jgi:hypothetical protein
MYTLNMNPNRLKYLSCTCIAGFRVLTFEHRQISTANLNKGYLNLLVQFSSVCLCFIDLITVEEISV